MEGLIKAQKILSEFPKIEAHGRRVSILAGKLATALKCPEVMAISIAGYLHDIGKTAWPPELHNKPLSPSSLVRAYPLLGEKIIVELWPDVPPLIKTLIRSHNERPDGKGFPDGLTHISNEILILAACDTYDTLISKTHSLTDEYAFKELAKFLPNSMLKPLVNIVKRRENSHKTTRYNQLETVVGNQKGSISPG